MDDNAAPMTTPELQVSPEVSRMGLRIAKLFLPFLILFFLKLLADSFFSVLFVFSIIVCLTKMRKSFELQLSMKKKSNGLFLIYLLVIDLLILLYLFVYVHYFANVRTILTVYSHSNHQSGISEFLNLLWCCWVFDVMVQVSTICVKLIVCIYIGSKSALKQPGGLKHFCNLGRLRNSIRSLRRVHRSPRADTEAAALDQVVDLESNFQTLLSRTSFDFSFAQNILQRNLFRFPSRGNGARAEETGNAPAPIDITSSDSSAGGNTNLNSGIHNRLSVHSIPVATSVSMNEDSKDADEQESSVVYLHKLKLCSLLDIASYILRTIMPMPIWFTYFSGGFTGMFLPLCYACFKSVDLTWKFRGFFEAFHFYIGDKLVRMRRAFIGFRCFAVICFVFWLQEFGHYSTAAEYSSSSSLLDCPICFDSPTSAVTLDCHHIFCEMCISEWLDKEKTCPVCRGEIKPVSEILGAIKSETDDVINLCILF